MKPTPTNLIILLLGVIISLISYIFISKTAELGEAQAATAANVTTLQNSVQQMNVYYVKIDARLSNIEQKLGIKNVAPLINGTN